MEKNVTNQPFFNMNNCNDLLKKAKREYENIKGNGINVDNLYNLIMDLNHMRDWILNDKRIKQHIKNIAKEKFDPNINEEFGILKSICNKGKHFELDPKNKQYEVTVISEQGYGCGGYGFGVYGEGEIDYKAVIDSSDIRIIDICEKVITQFDTFIMDNELNK